jgi:hypothetical protein
MLYKMIFDETLESYAVFHLAAGRQGGGPGHITPDSAISHAGAWLYTSTNGVYPVKIHGFAMFSKAKTIMTGDLYTHRSVNFWTIIA